MDKKIFNNKIDVKMVLPVSYEFKGLMVTLANTFVMHGGILKEYNKNKDEESLLIETNEIAYHLLKDYLENSFSCLEIDDNEGFKILVLQSVGLE